MRSLQSDNEIQELSIGVDKTPIELLALKVMETVMGICSPPIVIQKHCWKGWLSVHVDPKSRLDYIYAANHCSRQYSHYDCLTVIDCPLNRDMLQKGICYL